MDIGIPKEIKTHEYRVGLIPANVRRLVEAGHNCRVQAGAGSAIGYSDADYRAAGAIVVPTLEAVYDQSRLIVKVKEPQPRECERLGREHTVFSFLHLAAAPDLTRRLLDAGTTGIAFETVTDSRGHLPLLAPMSEVAGRMAVQAGIHHLENPQGGRGVLLGGITNVEAGKVVVIGGGVVGTQAARVALGLGADVLIFDKSEQRLAELEREFAGRLRLALADSTAVIEAVQQADLVVGAVLVSGAKAPKVLSRQDIADMLPGSVLVDVAIDQGGCFETSKPTTHDRPTFVVDDVIHYCVANIPGAVARTSTQALNRAIFPYLQRLADGGVTKTLAQDPHFRAGLNVYRGEVTHSALAESLGLPYRDPEELLVRSS